MAYRKNATPPARLAQIQKDIAAGEMTMKQIAEKNQVHVSTLYVIKKRFGVSGKPNTPYNKANPNPKVAKVLKLVSEGLSAKEVAKRLKMTVAGVNYYKYKYGPKGGLTNGFTNGSSPKIGTHLKVAHLVGIAYNERERFTEKVVEALSARHGVSASLLRHQLSKLL
jgi:transposase